jgi:predicted exporter
VDDAMTNDKVVPDTHDKVANLWFFLDGQEILPQMVSPDLTEGLVQAMVATRDTQQVKSILRDLDAQIAALPKTVVAVTRADVPAGTRPLLDAYTADRAAIVLEWDLRKYYHDLRLEKSAVEKTIAATLATAARDKQALGPIDAERLLKTLLPLLPEKVRNDTRWQETAVNDLKELNDTVVFVPEALYALLGIPTASQPEKIAMAMTYTGMPLIYQHLDQSLLDSQVESFIIALIFIYILLALQLRSFAGGLIGLLPIVLTVFITFGFMGYAHIPLDVATVLVASIALGIGIDYAIHFCMRFKHYFEISRDLGTALENTLHTTGKAIIINVVSVTMGFLTLMFADLIPLKRFGLLVSLTMVFSGLASITLLPSLIILTRAGFVGSWDRIGGKIKAHWERKGGDRLRKKN